MNVRRLFPFALFVLLFAVAVQPTIDPDMWWHLRTGEAILRDGIPSHDLFSFTYPSNEWVTHEWLSQVLMWQLYQLGGLNLLIFFFATVTTVTWGLVYVISDAKPYVAGMVVAVAAKASQVVWGSRPQLFNLLFLAVFVYLLERRKDGSIGRGVYLAFPLLTLLWANLHSGFLLGIVVLVTYLVGDLYEGRRRAPAPRTLPAADLVRLAAATGAAVVAAMANPNGARLLVYPFETLGSSVQRDFITEWFPPAPDQLIFWLLVALIATGLFGFVRSSRAATATELLVFGGTAVGAFLSVRNIPIFAIAVTPILCRHLATALPLARLGATAETGRRLPTLAAGAAILAAAVLIATGTIGDNARTVRNTFPELAVDHLEETGRSGQRMFNAYGWGGYLIWREIPVYIDGRADVYGDAGLLNFGRTWHVEHGWQEPLDHFEVQLVLVPTDSRLAATLEASPNWLVEYEDPLARIFTRPN